MITLWTELLAVELREDRPVVAGYRHALTGAEFEGATTDGTLAINGTPVPWSAWKIAVDVSKDAASYQLALPAEQVKLSISFRLADSILHMRLDDVLDPLERLKTLEWIDLPLLTCTDPGYSRWAVMFGEQDFRANLLGGCGCRESRALVKVLPVQDSPSPVACGCVFRPEQLCAFVYSTYPYQAYTHQVMPGGRYGIGLNTYTYRVRSRLMQPLEVDVVFLQDMNGDGRADESEYRLWVNRRLPDADPIYKDHLWYKINIQDFVTGVTTTFAQAEEMVRAMHNVTDGIPQVVYLADYEFDDGELSPEDRDAIVNLSGFPPMDDRRKLVGTLQDLKDLIAACRKKYNTIISYHMNIDERYVLKSDLDRGLWTGADPATMALAANGEVMVPGRLSREDYVRLCAGNPAWLDLLPRDVPAWWSYHYSHARQVETGALFRRLERFLRVMPVERTMQWDAMRITNCNPAWEPEGIGPLEELYCGLMPAAEWLRRRGISLTTEGLNGNPSFLEGVVSGFWWVDAPESVTQLLWGKVVGGSRRGMSRREWGLGQSLALGWMYDHMPDYYRPMWFWEYRTPGDWETVIDHVYLGSLLYHFYLQWEMTRAEYLPGGYHLEFGRKEVTADFRDGHLSVAWGDVTIADDDDRFIPRDKAIYAYSLSGSDRQWVLPTAFRGQTLSLCTLSREGRGPAPKHWVEKDRVRLIIEPRTPVKIVAVAPA